MSPSEFAQTLAAARKNGPEALQSLAEKHLPLVRALLRRFPSACVSREEMYQQGVIGLMKALRNFDPARGTAFSTYAAAVILGEMRMLQRQTALIHIPRTELEIRRKIQHTAARLAAEMHREPTVNELADAIHMDAAELMLHMEEISVASTDAKSPGGSAVADMLSDPDDWQKRIELRDILSRLPEKDQQLVLLRHRVGLTQTQAGQRLGMTQMQVSRREKIIRTLLKRALAE